MTTDKYVLGIDLGGTNIKGALLDLKANIVLKEEIPTIAEEGPHGVADRISRLALELMDKTGMVDCTVGIGIGVPGQSDPVTGCVFDSPNLCWKDVYIVDLVQKGISLPIFIENDANAAALGEKWCGAGKEARTFVAVTIGTGIGGGIIIDGKLYRGVGGTAGEIGHTIIMPDGPRCSCGNKGCLEALTAAPAILRRAEEVVKGGLTTALTEVSKLTVKDIFAVAAQGDTVALKIIDETAYYLSIGLANIINTINPELVVVGGGVSRGGEALFAPLRKYTLSHCLPTPASVVQVVPALLGNDAGFIGAAGVALQELGFEI